MSSGEPEPGFKPLPVSLGALNDAPPARMESELEVSSLPVTHRLSSITSSIKPKPLTALSDVLKRDVRLSMCEGSAYGVMIGVGESYFQAFALAMGLGEVFAALIATVPQFLGSLLQLVSPYAIRKLHSHKKWVAICAGLQAISFLPLLMAAWTGLLSQAAMLVIISFYWAASLATGPAWNTWHGTVIPRHIRAKFFALRARLYQVTTLVGFLAAGFALKFGRADDYEVTVYAILFAIALICRAISTVCLILESEPVPIPADMQFLTLAEQWDRFSRGPSGRILVFAVAMQVAVFIAGPFFVPYMLKELGFEYHHFAVLIGVSYLAKFVTLPAWGRLAQITGAHRLLWIGAIGLVPLSGGWVLGSNYYWLLALQFISGTAWAAYELALVLLFIETIPEFERTSLLTLYNVANSLGLAVGFVIGAIILNVVGISIVAYLWVFGASTIVRLLTLALLRRVPAPPIGIG